MTNMKILENKNGKYKFEVEVMQTVEETYSLEELTQRLAKMESKKTQAEESLASCNAEIEKITSLIELING